MICGYPYFRKHPNVADVCLGCWFLRVTDGSKVSARLLKRFTMTIPNLWIRSRKYPHSIYASNISTWSGFQFKHCLFKDLQYQQLSETFYIWQFDRQKGIKMLGQNESRTVKNWIKSQSASVVDPVIGSQLWCLSSFNQKNGGAKDPKMALQEGTRMLGEICSEKMGGAMKKCPKNDQ